MNRILLSGAVSVLAFGIHQATPVRWVPDPIYHGSQTYIPDGSDCKQFGAATRYYCWPSGTPAPKEAALIHGPVLAAPTYRAAPVRRPALPQRAAAGCPRIAETRHP